MVHKPTNSIFIAPRWVAFDVFFFHLYAYWYYICDDLETLFLYHLCRDPFHMCFYSWYGSTGIGCTVNQLFWYSKFNIDFVLTLLLMIPVITLFFFIFQNQINFKSYLRINSVILLSLTLLLFFETVMHFTYNKTYVYKSNLSVNLIISQENLINFYFDYQSVWFIFTTTIIGLFTNLYSMFYMQNELKKEKFVILLNLFLTSMIFLILSNSLFNVLVFWELLGITSFFLINFYDTKLAALKSSFKAFFFNRLSDVLIFFTVYLFINSFGNTDLAVLYNTLILNYKNYYILVLLIICSFIKSAQFIFYYWLPDSMDAPIPASALIHSATLVSAGIYLLLRFNFLIPNPDQFFTKICLLISSLTLLIISLILVLQTDLKKILAYSTITNCAFIYILIFYKQSYLALIYFTLHGLSKSNLFLYFGTIIKINNHYQDFRSVPQIEKTYLFLNNNYIWQVLLLSAFPGSITYYIKHVFTDSINFNLFNFFIFNVLCLYGMISLMYGLKLILLLHNYKTSGGKTCNLANTTDTNKSFLTSILTNYSFIILIISYTVLYYITDNQLYTNHFYMNHFYILTYLIILNTLFYYKKINKYWILPILSILLFFTV